MKNYEKSRIEHSCDICIVNNYEEDGLERQEYIKYNKEQRSYSWEKQSKGYYNLPEKIKWIKNESLWNEVRDRYIELKNTNEDKNKHSRTLFAIAVHEICQRYGYYQRKTY